MSHMSASSQTQTRRGRGRLLLLVKVMGNYDDWSIAKCKVVQNSQRLVDIADSQHDCSLLHFIQATYHGLPTIIHVI